MSNQQNNNSWKNEQKMRGCLKYAMFARHSGKRLAHNRLLESSTFIITAGKRLAHSRVLHFMVTALQAAGSQPIAAVQHTTHDRP
jgi:hypothetical protein